MERPKPSLRQPGVPKRPLPHNFRGGTKMNLAEDVDQWNTAIEQYYAGNLDEAVSSLEGVNKTAKIEYNIGFIYMFRQDLQSSNQYLLESVKRDPHLAIAHFALGLNYYNMNRCKEALASFESAKKGLRNAKVLDYKQLGLNFQLTYSEIMLNIGVTLAKQGHEERARVAMLKALESKGAKEYGVINDALDRLQGDYPLTPAQLPYNAIFRPPKSAVDNVKRRDYLGKAKVLFSANTKDTSAGFSGLQKLKDRRQSLLQEIQEPGRKESLKKVTTPPEKPLPMVGRVLESPTAGRAVARRPVSLSVSASYDTTEERREWYKKRHLSHLDEPAEATEIHVILPPPDYEGAVVEEVQETPAKSPVVSAKSKDIASATLLGRPECPVKPLPRMPSLQRPPSPGLIPPRSPRSCKKLMGQLQLNLQFSFACQVPVHASSSLKDIVQELRNQSMPKEIDICYTDELGRQHTLTEHEWDSMAAYEKSTLKFLCFGR